MRRNVKHFRSSLRPRGWLGTVASLRLDEEGPVRRHGPEDSPNVQHCKVGKMLLKVLKGSQSQERTLPTPAIRGEHQVWAQKPGVKFWDFLNMWALPKCSQSY